MDPLDIRALLYPAEPPCGYVEISAALGSIGPMRARYLARLRRSPHLAALADIQAKDTEHKQARGDRDG